MFHFFGFSIWRVAQNLENDTYTALKFPQLFSHMVTHWKLIPKTPLLLNHFSAFSPFSGFSLSYPPLLQRPAPNDQLSNCEWQRTIAATEFHCRATVSTLHDRFCRCAGQQVRSHAAYHRNLLDHQLWSGNLKLFVFRIQLFMIFSVLKIIKTTWKIIFIFNFWIKIQFINLFIRQK